MTFLLDVNVLIALIAAAKDGRLTTLDWRLSSFAVRTGAKRLAMIETTPLPECRGRRRRFLPDINLCFTAHPA